MGTAVTGGVRVAVEGGAGPDAPAVDFAAWVGPHVAAMNHLAARLVGPADREDVVQESLVRAWRRRSTYDATRGSAPGWLLAIVTDQARRRRTRERPPVVVLEESDGAVVDSSRDIDLERAISQLSHRRRLAVNLHYFVGLDIATCAEVMGCAEGTVKATLHQARSQLLVLLDDGKQ